MQAHHAIQFIASHLYIKTHMNRHTTFVISVLVGMAVTYAALMMSPKYLGVISRTFCSDHFTLPGLACRYGGMALTLALIPVVGWLAYFATRKMLMK